MYSGPALSTCFCQYVQPLAYVQCPPGPCDAFAAAPKYRECPAESSSLSVFWSFFFLMRWKTTSLYSYLVPKLPFSDSQLDKWLFLVRRKVPPTTLEKACFFTEVGDLLAVVFSAALVLAILPVLVRATFFTLYYVSAALWLFYSSFINSIKMQAQINGERKRQPEPSAPPASPEPEEAEAQEPKEADAALLAPMPAPATMLRRSLRRRRAFKEY